MVNKTPKIAIIGAGLAGLTCAQALAARGIPTVIFDKGRGVGGRLSTRRAEGGLQFDHGARYLSAQSDGFHAMLCQAEAAGAVARWPLNQQEKAFVGIPGMTGLPKYMAQDLDIRKGVRIKRIVDVSGKWQLEWDGGSETFDRVVVTAPAPQTVDLLPKDHPIAEALATVDMDHCLTLMVALANNADCCDITQRDPSPQISWVVRDSNKPGRPDRNCYVAHAAPDWSLQHLEMELDEIATLMLPLVSSALGIKLTPELPYVAAHRWRYALVSKPLGQPFTADTSRTLFAGGDWCLGKTAEDAWTSGKAIADAIVSTL